MLESLKRFFSKEDETLEEKTNSIEDPNIHVSKILTKYISADNDSVVGIGVKLSNKKETVITSDAFMQFTRTGEIPAEVINSKEFEELPAIKLGVRLVGIVDTGIPNYWYTPVSISVTNPSENWLSLHTDGDLLHRVWDASEDLCGTKYYLACSLSKGSAIALVDRKELIDILKYIHIPNIYYRDDIGVIEPIPSSFNIACEKGKDTGSKAIKAIKAQIKIMKYLGIRKADTRPVVTVSLKATKVIKRYQQFHGNSSNIELPDICKKTHSEISGIAVNGYVLNGDILGYKIMTSPMQFETLSVTDLSDLNDIDKMDVSNLTAIKICGDARVMASEDLPEEKFGLACSEALIKESESYTTVAVNRETKRIYYAIDLCPSPKDLYLMPVEQKEKSNTLFKLEFYLNDKVYKEVCTSDDVAKLLTRFDIPGLKLMFNDNILIDCALTAFEAVKDKGVVANNDISNSELVKNLDVLAKSGLQRQRFIYKLKETKDVVESVLEQHNIEEYFVNDVIADKYNVVEESNDWMNAVRIDKSKEKVKVDLGRIASDILNDDVADIAGTVADAVKDVINNKRNDNIDHHYLDKDIKFSTTAPEEEPKPLKPEKTRLFAELEELADEPVTTKKPDKPQLKRFPTTKPHSTQTSKPVSSTMTCLSKIPKLLKELDITVPDTFFEPSADSKNSKMSLYNKILKLNGLYKYKKHLGAHEVYIIDTKVFKGTNLQSKFITSDPGIVLVIPDKLSIISDWRYIDEEKEFTQLFRSIINKEGDEHVRQNLYLVGGSRLETLSGLLAGIDVNLLSLEYLDTSNVCSTSYMFKDAIIRKANFKNFFTGRVTDMSGMFFNAQIPSLDLSSFDTQNVKSMHSMFAMQNAISSEIIDVDLSSFSLKEDCVTSCMFNKRKCNITASDEQLIEVFDKYIKYL